MRHAEPSEASSQLGRGPAAPTMDMEEVHSSRLPTVTSENSPLLPPTREAALPEFEILPRGDKHAWMHSPDLEVTGELGSGGMAVVQAAQQCSLGRSVAIKLSHHASPNTNTFRSVIKEARIMGRLDHPNIPPIHMLGRNEAGNVVMVMKQIEGDSLSDLIGDPSHPRWSTVHLDREEWVLRVFMQICQAVQYAHSKGILHRDIKADNVMTGDFGLVYLIDWGIAVELDDLGSFQAKSFCGTPSHAAPEMVRAPRQLSVATDIYLLGALLHEVLTGRPPHTGEDTRECLQMAERSETKAYTEKIDGELAGLCRRAMHRDPEQRFEDAGAFLRAVESYLAQRHIRALVATALDLRIQVRQQLHLASEDTSAFHTLATRCRFAFEQARDAGASPEVVRRGLSECIEAQLHQALHTEAFQMARVYLRELSDLDSVAFADLDLLVTQIEQAEQAAKLRRDEITTQIQYRLMARLEQAEAALQDKK